MAIDMTRLFRWLSLFFVALNACAQNTDLDMEVMRLYRNSVPVLHTTEISVGAKVLDARERKEYMVSHLPNAKWVGHDDFELGRVEGIRKTDTILVYCTIGYRSERVGEKLLAAGYENVFNLYGGIFQWKNLGGVVLDSENDTTQRVHCYNKSWSRFLKKGVRVY
jgi:rhodanese-related sulfurtransferase